jgi:surface antigen
VKWTGLENNDNQCAFVAILEGAAMRHHGLLPVLLMAICLSQPAFAQINPFRGSVGTPLTAADIAALTDATNRLLDRPDLNVGDTETWSNSQSGVTGSVAAGSAEQHNGLACRVVLYQHTVPGANPQRSATLTWCKTKDGWKIG